MVPGACCMPQYKLGSVTCMLCCPCFEVTGTDTWFTTRLWPPAACTVLTIVAVCLCISLSFVLLLRYPQVTNGLMTWHDSLFTGVEITAVPTAESCNCCATQQRIFRYSCPRFANNKDNGSPDIAIWPTFLLPA